MKSGILYGVGVGPGDPELLTLKATRILRDSDVIAAPGRGDKIAVGVVSEYIAGKTILHCETPMVRDRARLDLCYNKIADDIAELLQSGKQVAFITIGDPSIYSTYIYVQRKILDRGFNAEFVPGVPSFCAAAARLNMPLCEGAERLLIVPARDEYSDTMDIRANKVFMKAGSGMSELRQKLSEKGFLEKSALIENCGMAGEKIWPKMELLDEPTGYFSIVICKEGD